jgi:putative RNA 2'-phosphotransferase
VDELPKKNLIKVENLGRLMAYILGHKPYEFCLVPDTEGFVPYKELLRAIHEEPGWGYVKQGDINEVLLGKSRLLFQTRENQIRAIDRQWGLDFECPTQSVPKIIFIGIRRRAHPVVMEKGLRKIDETYYVLSPDRKIAERIGKRRDPQPVLLEIMAGLAQEEGVLFYPFGNLLLAVEIPARYMAGPPVPKEFIKAGEDDRPKKKQEPHPDFQGGTFVLDIERDMDQSRNPRGKKKRGWKEEARRDRRKNRGKSF